MNTRLVGLLLVLGWASPGFILAAGPDTADGADGRRGRRVLDEMYDASVAHLPDADRARLYECALKGPDGVSVAFAGFGPDGYGPERWPLPIRVPMLYEMPMPFKLSGIPGEADAALYVVLTPKVLPLDRIAMLRTAKPALTMTKADLAAALSGKDITKILVLPREEGEQAVKPELEAVTSADLDPKADLVAAASQRGEVVATLLISKNAPPSPFTLPVGDEQLPFRLIGPEGLTLTSESSARGKFDGQLCEVPAEVGLPFDGARRLKLGGTPVSAKTPIYASLKLARPLPEEFLRLHASELLIAFTQTDLDAALEGGKVTCVAYLSNSEKEGDAPHLRMLSSANKKQAGDPVAEASQRGAILVTVILSRRIADLPAAAELPAGDKAAVKGQQGDSQATQIAFCGLEGLTIHWDVTAPGKFDSDPIVVPGRFIFPRAAAYRLKLSRIPGHEGVQLYATLEVAPTLPHTEAYLKNNAVPVEFSGVDIDCMLKGKPLIKIVYLPNEADTTGLETLVSSDPLAGVDLILEASRRGTILAILRAETEPTPVVKKPSASVTPEADGAEE